MEEYRKDIGEFGEDLAGDLLDVIAEKVNGKDGQLAVCAPLIAAAHVLLHYAQVSKVLGATENPLEWAIHILASEWERVQEISSVTAYRSGETKH